MGQASPALDRSTPGFTARSRWQGWGAAVFTPRDVSAQPYANQYPMRETYANLGWSGIPPAEVYANLGWPSGGRGGRASRAYRRHRRHRT